MAGSTLTFNQVKEELKQPGVILLDVRGQEEVHSGKIASSKNVPVSELSDAIKMNDTTFKQNYGFDKLSPEDKIVVYCKAGVRAQKAAKTLTNAGFKNVKVYPGMDDWISHGGPVVK